MEFLQKNKQLVIIGAVVLAAVVVFIVMSGGSSVGTVSGNGKVDNSKSVTASQDNLSGGSVKLGNVGSIGGNLDLSKHNTTDNSKKEGNE
jgi:hypothetical protein